ncbi:hypothetical protein D3C87_1663700 [compost metagenome]
MAEQYRDGVVIADTQERIGCKDVALIFRRPGKTMATRDDKRHHQPTTQHSRALEETATR